MTGKTVAIILARGGSKGIPGKNMRRLAGLSLVARSIRAARAAKTVTSVHVSTDDPAIAAEALRFGALVIERPAALSGDTASSESGWQHALAEIIQDCRDSGQPVPDQAVFLQCTSPFTTGADIAACLATMNRKRADCALSVLPDHGFIWQEDPEGFGQGSNHNHKTQRQRRQDLPPRWRESGAIYTVRVPAFLTTGQRFCGSVALCPVDHPPVEIDTLGDLDLCAQLILRHDLSAPEPARLQAVRILVMDFDGVHTDDTAFVTQDGSESVRVSRSDGMGLGRLRDAGRIALLIVSKERNPVVATRAAKLAIPALQGIDDKVSALESWLSGHGLDWRDVLYVGNDINDAAAMAQAGLSACPCDAHPEILASADWVLPRPGGRGALRVLAEALLAAGSA